MNETNYFTSDAIDDTNVDLFAGPPTLTDVDGCAAAMLVAPMFRLAADALQADPGFLQIVAPDLYLARGSLAWKSFQRFVLGRPYVDAVGVPGLGRDVAAFAGRALVGASWRRSER